MMNEMDMHEPERGPQSGQEWQGNQPYGGYRAEQPGRYEPEPEQQQKIYPQAESQQRGAVPLLGIAAILLSAPGFFFALAGIIGSAIALQFSNGEQAVVAGSIIGLLGSILALLMFVAIFVIAVVALARRFARSGTRGFRRRVRWQ